MEKSKAIFRNAWPYQQDKMNLPVENVEAAIPFYETVMGFTVVSKKSSPYNTAVLSRDDIQVAISENGGDPAQDGCFFEVDNIVDALEELSSNGLEKKASDIGTQKHGDSSWKVFFVVAPDGLCYCLGERQH
ncbi:MAG: VOC family protein [Chitinophagaceae bacterium]|nr:VOC family protein [Chitinophagaceae bacterium]